MTNEQNKKCQAIIHTASVAAGGVGAGLAQIPGSDNAVIVPIQVTMTISLGTVFGIKLDESAAKATLATATASMTGRAISQFLVGWIPGAGNLMNAATAAGITETIGWALAKDFSSK
ncbi:MAG: hypothetical protein LIR50_21175 [Bacillota bacterium]|nr:hypothetical protein [Bacillota bacterium]